MDAFNAWYGANNNLINTVGLNGILALSIYVMLACGQLSLASPGYMAVGAYTAALLTTNTGVCWLHRSTERRIGAWRTW